MTIRSDNLETLVCSGVLGELLVREKDSSLDRNVKIDFLEMINIDSAESQHGEKRCGCCPEKTTEVEESINQNKFLAGR